MLSSLGAILFCLSMLGLWIDFPILANLESRANQNGGWQNSLFVGGPKKSLGRVEAREACSLKCSQTSNEMDSFWELRKNYDNGNLNRIARQNEQICEPKSFTIQFDCSSCNREAKKLNLQACRGLKYKQEDKIRRWYRASIESLVTAMATVPVALVVVVVVGSVAGWHCVQKNR